MASINGEGDRRSTVFSVRINVRDLRFWGYLLYPASRYSARQQAFAQPGIGTLLCGGRMSFRYYATLAMFPVAHQQQSLHGVTLGFPIAVLTHLVLPPAIYWMPMI